MEGYNEIEFSEKLCNQSVKNSDLWDVSWISSKDLKNIVKNNSIFNKANYGLMDFVIRQKEFDIFSYDDERNEQFQNGEIRL